MSKHVCEWRYHRRNGRIRLQKFRPNLYEGLGESIMQSTLNYALILLVYKKIGCCDGSTHIELNCRGRAKTKKGLTKLHAVPRQGKAACLTLINNVQMAQTVAQLCYENNDIILSRMPCKNHDQR
jgi:hypothetical protein